MPCCIACESVLRPRLAGHISADIQACMGSAPLRTAGPASLTAAGSYCDGDCGLCCFVWRLTTRAGLPARVPKRAQQRVAWPAGVLVEAKHVLREQNRLRTTSTAPRAPSACGRFARGSARGTLGGAHCCGP